ncbi:Membrane protein involved in the export of O-antigen and teichoic acid [Mucilaginibacter gossypiicola]|uniref:Membrane protein involved in the export of O-antigen and teichoic acid n=1 Tax=Mucilaginibacter gossypiicola TaxID=551995 RepID=A0A1H8AKW3_9SPHI|nr:flippase [Mucilaginibacter gossypiicola]SEM71271.1 Membrane protein involved in the export of O-antigen and teichoic acid [Mucilaginibacter gossypiicola]
MLKKNIFFNFLLSVSQILFSVIIFPFASRTLGPDGIGSVVFIDSITQIFLLIAALGIPIYGVREISKVKDDPDQLSSLFSELVTIHMICTAIFVVTYVLAGIFIGKINTHLNLVLIGAFILICNVFTIEWFFQGIEQFTYITKRTLLVRGLFLILLFGFVHHKGDEPVYYGLTAASYFFNALFNFIYSKKIIRLSFKHLNLKKHVKPLLVILCSNIVITVYLLMDNTILGFLKGEVPVGFYSTAVKIAKISITIVTALGAVLIPQISQAFKKGDHSRIQLLINKSFNFVCTFGIPISVGIIIMAPFIITTLVGKSFSQSIVPLQILSPIIFIIGATNVFAWQILSPLGNDKKVLIVVLCGMVVSLSINFAVIPTFSANGAAFANICTELVVMLLSFYFVYRLKVVAISAKPIFSAALGSGVFFLIAYIARKLFSDNIITEISIMLSCVIFYAIYQIKIIKNEIIFSIIHAGKNKISNVFNHNKLL